MLIFNEQMFFFQAEDGIRYLVRSRGLGDVYKRQVPTLAAQNSGLVEKFKLLYPGKEIPTDILVHPAPIYETLMALIIFYILWKLRLKPWVTGKLFAIYLIFAGIERLCIESVSYTHLTLPTSDLV